MNFRICVSIYGCEHNFGQWTVGTSLNLYGNLWSNPTLSQGWQGEHRVNWSKERLCNDKWISRIPG